MPKMVSNNAMQFAMEVAIRRRKLQQIEAEVPTLEAETWSSAPINESDLETVTKEDSLNN